MVLRHHAVVQRKRQPRQASSPKTYQPSQHALKFAEVPSGFSDWLAIVSSGYY